MFSHSTSFAERFGIRSPGIIQAPMAGGITTPEFVAAVSNAQGLGSFATGYLTPEEVHTAVKKIKALTSYPFAVNIFIPAEVAVEQRAIQDYRRVMNQLRSRLNLPQDDEDAPYIQAPDYFEDMVEIIFKEHISVVSFTFGNLPEHLIQRFKKAGIYLIGTATSVAEAIMLQEAGIDAICVQGVEAGGHRGNFHTATERGSMGLMALLPQVVQAVDRPVIAAGGIMNGQGVVAALALGASAVQMGTAFLTTQESGANTVYKAALIETKAAVEDMTVLTSVYSGKLVRGIKTAFIKSVESQLNALPPYPIPHYISAPIRREAAKQQNKDYMSMWSGQGAPLITEHLSVAELIDNLHAQVQDTLDVLCME